jgi:hypothetical protein
MLIAIAFLLPACVSHFANNYIGKTPVDLELDLGRPANIVELHDGRRSYQYFWGGGNFVTPQNTSSRVSVIGNTAYINTQTAPSLMVSSEGCLVNFIAERRASQWVIVEARWPRRMVC